MGLSRRQVYEGVQLAALQGLEMGASVAEVASVEPFSSSVALLLNAGYVRRARSAGDIGPNAVK